MRRHDVGEAERLSSGSFRAPQVTTRPAGQPEPTYRPEPAGRDEAAAASWRRRLEHLLVHDAGGCWVAEDETGMVGFASSLRRETWWGLSGYFVRSDRQGTGVGTRLLEAALTHSQGAVRGLICSTSDPRAVRRYRTAGFTLHPSMLAYGTVDRSLLPVVDHVREGSAADLDLCDSLDRRTRGAGHGVDHPLILDEHRLVIVDNTTGSGYCYLNRSGGPYLLAASNMRTAQRLLWESLAHTRPDVAVRVRYLSAEQEWAVDVALAARLEIHNEGYLAYRFMKPATPYVPSVHLM